MGDVGFSYNRKEAKDHGEGGMLDAAGATLAGVVIALDRQERTGKDGELSELSAVQSVEAEFGVPVRSIIGLDGLLAYLEVKGSESLASYKEAVRQYRSQYGVNPS